MYTTEKTNQWLKEAERIAQELQELGKSLPHALDQFALADVAEAAARGDRQKAQKALAFLRNRLTLVTAEHTEDSFAPRNAKFWHK